MSKTPMMAQWQECKESAPGALLFFRLGDFYEAFYEDAEILASTLDLTLTKRGEVPMAGVPYHSAETYLDRLIAKGYRVAIAEQMENPKESKGIVKRQVTRIVTPGTLIQSHLIEDKEHRYLVALHQINQRFGLAVLEITTATFFVSECEKEGGVLDELSRIQPKEILLEKKWKGKAFVDDLQRGLQSTLHFLAPFHFEHKGALQYLLDHFSVQSLDGFGLKGMVASVNAAGALLSYVGEELKLPTDHIRAIQPTKLHQTMQIDGATRKHLELSHPLHEGRSTTLLHLIDQTKTPMGGRLIRNWLLNPLLSVEEIGKRQDQIAAHMEDFPKLLQLRGDLAEIRDLQRLMMRVETGYATPRDLSSLKLSLMAAAKIEEIGDLSDLIATLDQALVDAPPMRLSDAATFRKGYDSKLDECTAIKGDSKTWIAHYQTQLRESLGIKTLKVGYTRAFGYYIEVSRGQSGKVPQTFQRKQTLVNGERFVTDKLKEFEYKILSADEKIRAIESALFQSLCGEVGRYAKQVQLLAQTIASIDCFSALAKLALERDYVRPLVDESDAFAITQGRHPVIETAEGVHFIPNDLHFSGQLAILTGPNMAGKSTYIRQAALIAIMAQMGSFVPAKQAHIGLIDQVFSRIGASDDLSRGQSTFMVEMTETANILNNATQRSLIILDEIGRGTSTYDGISIAWAVAEYLLTTPGKQAKTLFATHYFEMTELAISYPAVFNLNVAVDETPEGIVFLRKIVDGIADKSYGIHVARLAGLPPEALRRAEAKLKELQREEFRAQKQGQQLDLFTHL